MTKEHIVLVCVETLDNEALKGFTDRVFFDMDIPGVYVTLVKDVKQ